MATLIELDGGLRPAYRDIVHRVRTQGKLRSPRGIDTLELRDVTITIADPVDCLLTGIGRGLNTKLAAVEALQVIGGFSDPELLVKASPPFAAFLDHGMQRGAYGPRTGWQVDQLIKRLRQDPNTRRGVLSIWEPRDLFTDGSVDYPCTLNLIFDVVDDRLDMLVSMRSSDVWLGIPYDVFMFSQLQIAVAKELNMSAGTYTHFTRSLHLYKSDEETVGRLCSPTEPGLRIRPPSPTIARMIANGRVDWPRPFSGEAWYIEQIARCR